MVIVLSRKMIVRIEYGRIIAGDGLHPVTGNHPRLSCAFNFHSAPTVRSSGAPGSSRPLLAAAREDSDIDVLRNRAMISNKSKEVGHLSSTRRPSAHRVSDLECGAFAGDSPPSAPEHRNTGGSIPAGETSPASFAH